MAVRLCHRPALSVASRHKALVAATALAFFAGCNAPQAQGGLSAFPEVVSPASVGRSGGPFLKEYGFKSHKLQQIFAVTFDAAGDLWFNSFWPYVGRRYPGGSVSIYALPRTHNAYGWESVAYMTLGPHQTIWFTDYYGKEIGTVDQKGNVKEYQPFAKTGYAFTAGIVASRQHLWVVMPNFGGAYLAEVSVRAKVVKRINLPGSWCFPEPIIADPTGTLWIGNSANCPKITRVTPDGKVTDFAVHGALGVWALAYGPDGNVWFTAGDGAKINDYIGKMTPTGHITEYPISDVADSIALGPDGNWWITLPFVGKIASMTLQGNIVAEYTLPNAVNGSQPRFQATQIAKGSDGNMWFGEGYRNKIGELVFLTPQPR